MMRRILYIAAVLPMRSETFVYREILALRALDFEIQTVSVHEPERGLGGPELDRLSDSTLQLYPSGASRLIRDAVTEFLRHPFTSLGTLTRVVLDAAFSSDVKGNGRFKVLWQGVAGMALACTIRPREIEHIHAHFANVPATIAMYAARQLQIGFSFTGHANDIFPLRVLLTEKIQRAQFVSCISEWHRAFYKSIFSRDDEDLPVVRCGVDTASYSVTPAPAGEIFELLAVGRLVEKKGFDVLLRALASVGAQLNSPIRLTLAGGGPMEEELHALAKALPSNVEVVLLGDTQNSVIMELMANADVFVLPCRVAESGDRDGIPVVLMEAMVRGRCVISGDLEAIRELVEDGVSGILVPAGDQAQLEHALLELQADSARIEVLGRGARRRVEQEFDLTLNARRLGAKFHREV